MLTLLPARSRGGEGEGNAFNNRKAAAGMYQLDMDLPAHVHPIASPVFDRVYTDLRAA